MPQIVVQVSPAAAKDLVAGKPKSSAARAIAHAVDAAGATVSPMHPGVTDPALSTYFSVDLHDGSSAAALALELSRMSSVEAAYVKPDDAPPGG